MKIHNTYKRVIYFLFFWLIVNSTTTVFALSRMEEPFFLDYTVLKGENSNESILDVYFYLFNNELIFLRHEKVFVASYKLGLSLYNHNGDLAGHQEYSELIEVNTYDETQSTQNPRLHRFNFIVKSGEYLISLKIYDHAISKSYSVERDIIIPLLEKSKLEMSDIVLGFRQRLTDENGSVKTVIPHVTKEFGPYLGLDVVGLSFEIYGIKTEMSKPLILDIIVLDENEQKIASFAYSITPEATDRAFQTDFSTENLATGEYNIIIEAWQNQIHEMTRKTASFTVYQDPVSMRFKSYYDALEELKYIVPKKELKRMRNVTNPRIQQKILEDFWAQRDPSKGTYKNELKLEYYRRLDFATKHFKSSDGKGWDTSQGRLFILYGEPDRIKRRTFPSLAGFPIIMEVWSYISLNNNFILISEHGEKQFQLANPQGDNWLLLPYQKYASVIF